MNLQTAIDVCTSHYIDTKEASLTRLMEALNPPDERRHRLIADLKADIAAAKQHRAAFGLSTTNTLPMSVREVWRSFVLYGLFAVLVITGFHELPDRESVLPRRRRQSGSTPHDAVAIDLHR
jgi:hypothetical protein